ncbi:hypothetical protein niasHT_004607 [Heterodera trifolii]|uniref:Uncharacterized protein n=1 Tax=Heterodera trifolii TaxID=157864 RepID=A0ABD2M7D0_9BILA
MLPYRTMAPCESAIDGGGGKGEGLSFAFLCLCFVCLWHCFRLPMAIPGHLWHQQLGHNAIGIISNRMMALPLLPKFHPQNVANKLSPLNWISHTSLKRTAKEMKPNMDFVDLGNENGKNDEKK